MIVRTGEVFVVVALALVVGSACAVRPGIAGSEYLDTRDRLRRPGHVQRLRRARRRACEAEMFDVAEPHRSTLGVRYGSRSDPERPSSLESYTIPTASAQPTECSHCDADDLAELVE